jgi:hypothetical protein
MTCSSGASKGDTMVAVGVAISLCFPAAVAHGWAKERRTCRCITAYTHKSTTVSIAKAAIRSGFFIVIILSS